ncbi:solute carrier family 2, facilitated glucose transporter member 8-like [Haliotis rubra]|uniref:solute carrier family 2, facilitated glucose transporter member 8-like n=1 Tax=Haliotis rubra TaxID=36100 RepID=UPI001EE5EECD|nr:solute carrier family 2, facilitated glucose transporter member 8-like [Haliotis rubra]
MASFEAAGGRLLQSRYEGAPRLVRTTVIACLGALCLGYVLGYSSPAIPSMVKSGVFTKQDAGWFGSLMTVGAILGGPAGGWCIEKFGRRKSLMIASVPFLLGAVQAALALVMSCFIPETPRWLLGKNKKAEAIQALKVLRDSHMDVQEECRDIEEGLDPQEEFAWTKGGVRTSAPPSLSAYVKDLSPQP